MKGELIEKLFNAESPGKTLRFSVYIPSKDCEGLPVDSARWRIKAGALLSQIAGGATESKATGLWLGDCGRFINEPVSEIYTFINEVAFFENAQKLKALLCEMGKELNQACVGFTVDNQFFLLSDYEA